jgi:predicted solute-binding protein
MDNQDSSPALIFPSVPDDFCPVGNWTQVFQQFSDIVLASGTVNIPGLADVTPQQIQTINNYLQSLQNQIDVLATTQVRQGTITIGAGTDFTIPITFATAMPSDNYTVAFTPVTTTFGTPSAPIFAVQTGSQTISGFTVIIDNNVATITTLDWVAIHSA